MVDHGLCPPTTQYCNYGRHSACTLPGSIALYSHYGSTESTTRSAHATARGPTLSHTFINVLTVLFIINTTSSTRYYLY